MKKLIDPMLAHSLRQQGYTHIVNKRGKVCAIKDFMVTTAIVVGLDDCGYQRRYCYEKVTQALMAYVAWDGTGHPPGPWVKVKGRADDGTVLDDLNPNLGG